MVKKYTLNISFDCFANSDIKERKTTDQKYQKT